MKNNVSNSYHNLMKQNNTANFNGMISDSMFISFGRLILMSLDSFLISVQYLYNIYSVDLTTNIGNNSMIF